MVNCHPPRPSRTRSSEGRNSFDEAGTQRTTLPLLCPSSASCTRCRLPSGNNQNSCSSNIRIGTPSRNQISAEHATLSGDCCNDPSSRPNLEKHYRQQNYTTTPSISRTHCP